MWALEIGVHRRNHSLYEKIRPTRLNRNNSPQTWHIRSSSQRWFDPRKVCGSCSPISILIRNVYVFWKVIQWPSKLYELLDNTCHKYIPSVPGNVQHTRQHQRYRSRHPLLLKLSNIQLGTSWNRNVTGGPTVVLCAKSCSYNGKCTHFHLEAIQLVFPADIRLSLRHVFRWPVELL